MKYYKLVYELVDEEIDPTNPPLEIISLETRFSHIAKDTDELVKRIEDLESAVKEA